MRIERGRVDLKIAAALTVIGALAVWLARGGPEGAWDTSVAAGAAQVRSAAHSPQLDAGAAEPADRGASGSEGLAAGPGAASAQTPLAPPSQPASELPAAWSLADARVAGDDRAPPMQRQAAEPAVPAWQLDDHAGYARREQDRHQAVQQAFVDAADRELPLIDQQIERGRAMGLPAEQLAKGEEKRRRIAEMRARMQAELKGSGPAP